MHFHSGGANYHIETNLSEIHPGHPVTAAPASGFDSTGATAGFTFSPGNGGPQSLPSMAGFSSYAVKLKGSDLIDMYVHNIVNCGDGVVFETLVATHGDLLDSRVYVHAFSGCTNAFRFIADSNSNVIQGVEALSNFATTCVRGCFYDASGLTPNWDANRVVFQAIDPTTAVANARGLYTNSNNVPNSVFRVECWFGGFNTSTGRYVEGNFDGLLLHLAFGEDIANYAMFALTGTNVTIETSPGNGSAATVVTCRNAANERASYNGGVPLTAQRIKSRITLASDLTTGSFRTAYAYSPYAGASELYTVTPGDMNGAVVTAVLNGSNANEIQVQVANFSGATIVSGTHLNFYLTAGSL